MDGFLIRNDAPGSVHVHPRSHLNDLPSWHALGMLANRVFPLVQRARVAPDN
jgi:hypothetical protein